MWCKNFNFIGPPYAFIIGVLVLLQTLPNAVNVSTTFQDIAFLVFVLIDVTSFTGCDNLGRGHTVVFKAH